MQEVRNMTPELKKIMEGLREKSKSTETPIISTGTTYQTPSGDYLCTLEYCGVMKRYANVTIDTLPDTTETAYVRKYAKNILQNIERGTGMILMGPVGTGKTTAAIAVMREAIDIGMKPLFIPMVSLLDTILSMQNAEERMKFENRVRNCPLLVLDDLGGEYIGADGKLSWAVNKIDAIVTERYNRMKPIIITTNLYIDDKYDANNNLVSSGIKGRYNERILDRLRSTSKLIVMRGQSKRRTEYDE